MELTDLTLQHWHGVVKSVSSEKEMYTHVKRKAIQAGFLYYKLENKYQQGIPDIMLIGDIIMLLECKVCRKKSFSSLSELHWQPGQLHFAYVALRRQAPLLYVVAHRDTWHILGTNRTLVNKIGALLC